MPTNAIVKGSVMWNLWHGCHKLSPGCKHCYVYRGDAKRDVDSSMVVQTKNFDWVMDLRSVCMEHGVAFWFKQTGAKFVKDGRLYVIKRQLQHSQARKAGINLNNTHVCHSYGTM